MDQLNHNKGKGELNPSTMKERDNAKTKKQKEKMFGWKNSTMMTMVQWEERNLKPKDYPSLKFYKKGWNKSMHLNFV